MDIFYDIDAWRQLRKTQFTDNTLGLVPTMGNLHRAHLSLVTQSQKQNDKTIVSIFVNQAQFNNPKDFACYPRTLDADLNELQRAGVDYCIIPTSNAIYPDHYQYQIHETTNHQRLEGKHRPGHFTGVLTVVMKLFNIVKPNRAYFGEKDYEQFQYIQRMTHALFMDIEVIPCPTLREPGGLAYSSRNGRLSADGREKAAIFARLFLSASSTQTARDALTDAGIEIEYLEEFEGRRFVAVLIDGVRLIDNYLPLDDGKIPTQMPISLPHNSVDA
jgi:pantoate--beta-alanine ligase